MKDLSIRYWGILLVLSFLLIFLDHQRFLRSLRFVTDAVVSPVELGVYATKNDLADTFSFLSFWKSGESRIKNLEQRNLELTAKAVRADGLERENQELRKQLGVAGFGSRKLLPASVQGLGKYLNKTIVAAEVIGLAFLGLVFLTLGGFYSLLLGLPALVLMELYSLPPIRFKKRRYLDIIIQIIAWGIIPYLAAIMLIDPQYLINTQNPLVIVNPWALIFMISFFTASAGLGPILDITADRLGKINNTTVVWGYKKSLTVDFFLLFFSLCEGLFLTINGQYPWYTLMLPPGMLALGVIGYARGNYDRQEKIDKILLMAKKWGKFTGWALFALLVFFLVSR